MKAIIFGASGQDGFFLSKLLKEKKIETVSISRNNPGFTIGSVTDFGFVENLIKSTRPDFVFHLAASSSTRHEYMFENHNAIATGSLNILDAVYKHSQHTKVFLSGSGLQFVNNGNPISESDPFEARDPYCISRIQSVYAARYFRRIGLSVYVGYFFHHDSELRSERHLNMKIAQAANRIKAGSTEKLQIGDTSVIKEYNFAGDLMNAIWLLVNQNNFFEAVVGSGVGHSIEEWLSICFGANELRWQDFVVKNDSFIPEFKKLISCPHLLDSLGWRPELEINALALRMLRNSA